ncbi:Peptidyl-prolyl cis-trans isomerase B [Poriferisphaera corsica]|uniref:Peptidyl-prolyl cis-trans isomerase n=1 Tax=Poriferisphaera corsica TaxID=2528020 RepID=A0A517YTC0_9BACT|nr:peptidylprolyl isomerase [Poriferisphaera corsica]QDU33464.1 Peptidyl-prolyl cis-trans isomerase B [Poriferisphaera corsica]
MPDYKQIKFETTEGDFIVELWDDVAPGHAENMTKLVNEGFYDGLAFHRIIPGFVIQGGCPRGDGTGGPGWNIKAEFNDREHHPGVLSMARSADPDSAGSQFFVCLTREYCQHLDGQYTGFGKVVEGFENVEKIAATPLSNPQAGTPENAPKINKATCL